MWKIILVCTVIGIVAEIDSSNYENHNIYLITPKTAKSIDALDNFKGLDGFEYLVHRNAGINDVVLIIRPDKMSEFFNIMTDIEATYRKIHSNFPTLLDEYYKHRSVRSELYSFRQFYTHSQINAQLDKLAAQYPKNVWTVVGGYSYEGREIKGVKVSFKENNPGIFIEGGIYCHQWMSPATVMYILHQLLTNNNTDVRELAERHDWYIFPVFNPDGYEFTFSSTFNRYWPKTRKPNKINSSTCIGTNLNMNWDYKWNTGGTSSDPCSPNYPGPEPFSEIEVKNMAEYIKTIADKFYAYISISGNQRFILFPYGYTNSEVVDNYKELIAIARKAKYFVQEEYDRHLVIGSVAEVYGTMSGCSVDYIRGVHGTRLVYMLHLHHHDGFNLPPEEIIPMSEKALRILIVMFKEAMIQENKRKKMERL